MPDRPTFPKWKYAVFALTAVLLSTAFTSGVVLAVDVYLHKRFERYAGLNVWGYRGRIVSAKRPGEGRVVFLGGSTAFGYGVPYQDAIPALLERQLNQARVPGPPISVVNLGYNNEGAYSLRFTLADYEYLDYDLAVFYVGYNDLGGSNTFVFRRASPIFRLTGYMPILPIILAEKAMALRHGGNLEAAYRGDKTVFRPDITQRTTAEVLEAALRISRSVESQLGRLSRDTIADTPAQSVAGCAGRWNHYCQWVATAADYALRRGKRVLVVGQPYISDEHVAQQAELAAMLRLRFHDEPRLRLVNLGRLLDLHEASLGYDGMHLTKPGNERVSRALVVPVLDLLR